MRHIILATITLLTSGCATVNSNFQTKGKLQSKKPDEIQGLLYFLPKRQVTLTATQTPVTAKTVKDTQQSLTKVTTEASEAKSAANEARQDFANAHTAYAQNSGVSVDEFVKKIAALQVSLKIKETILAKAESKRDKATGIQRTAYRRAYRRNYHTTRKVDCLHNICG